MLFSFLSVKCRKLTRSLRCLPVLTLPEFANPFHPRKKTVNSEVLTAPIKVIWGVKSKMQNQNWNPGRPAPNHVPLCPLMYQKLTRVLPRGARGAPHSLTSPSQGVTETQPLICFCFLTLSIPLQIKMGSGKPGEQKGICCLGRYTTNVRIFLPAFTAQAPAVGPSAVRRLIILAGQVVHFASNATVSLQKRQIFGFGPLF